MPSGRLHHETKKIKKSQYPQIILFLESSLKFQFVPPHRPLTADQYSHKIWASHGIVFQRTVRDPSCVPGPVRISNNRWFDKSLQLMPRGLFFLCKTTLQGCDMAGVSTILCSVAFCFFVQRRSFSQILFWILVTLRRFSPSAQPHSSHPHHSPSNGEHLLFVYYRAVSPSFKKTLLIKRRPNNLVSYRILLFRLNSLVLAISLIWSDWWCWSSDVPSRPVLDISKLSSLCLETLHRKQRAVDPRILPLHHLAEPWRQCLATARPVWMGSTLWWMRCRHSCSWPPSLKVSSR